MFFATAPAAYSHTLRRPAPAGQGRAVERLIHDALYGARQGAATFSQDDTSFTLSMDMPGISKEQLRITLDGATVRIQTKDDAPRAYRSAYELPQEIDSSLSEAKLEHGVLTLKLTKKVPVDTSAELTIQ
jgi:HSP20 family molecular chaperone IbpA